MITQETRERMENLIRCIQGKLNGKTMEWYDSNAEKWIPIAENDWNFLSTSKLRIAPEPQEKFKKWAVIWDSGKSSTFDTLKEAEDSATANYPIIELTETARIEPKKREPRRIWISRYSVNGNKSWGSVWDYYNLCHANTGENAVETAVEFVEVVK